jgi:hypothetical protein
MKMPPTPTRKRPRPQETPKEVPVKDDDRIRQELTRVANSRPKSGRGLQAKITALRTLERLNRADEDYGHVDPELVARLFDDRPDDQLVSEDDWYPSSGDDEGDATMKALDAWATLGSRRRLFLTLSEENQL